MLDRLLHRSKTSRGALAVVTGAGSGIGAAFALELGKRGGTVVCSDIDQAAAQRTADAITEHGAKALATRCDVSQFGVVQALAEQSQSWFGAPPTLVINNAGVGAGGAAIGDAPLDDWQWTLGINLWGPIHGCHVFTPILRDAAPSAAPRGIINVASAAAFGAAPGMAAYNVSKAGVLSLSETLAAELSGTPVRVTVLCPTFVKTTILESGRISEESGELAAKLMRWTGFSADKVARICLDAHDRGDLYCMPQLDAQIGWHIKRLAPQAYTRAAGLVSRINLP
ncbi:MULTISPECIES: SDR family NAD(P)-dependent oxidoreductase [Mycobacterium avium complex (MAC)]|jgi:NAD(P)-dependent dehydrogenase (short-subunit alcohol dehydrogenase family)|uniref:Short-chain dehydrogenase/reductase n=2 Tax=Mycobacterium avium TaxID=1764 RepID=A0AAI8X2D3_MYCAV|nr:MULTISPECIES: SDR family NAD(P)-dependent oxidoreductase [Mycobacterium avium complex (MAC)]ETB54044.1 short-chain dehydrogenase [Mycobacterium avium 10-5560]TXA41234.1 short-chain dehydrogenase [Mycobacterium tuberculosis variant bovis]ABK66029.1 oxidoreductase, short chain dehydrogenase/reductase family protein [Mycobacterium avium 104]KDP06875.1 short-chain dehydrogenase [Mycobacterium avium subsp. hominissuis 101]KDP10201.1 short-chain dehydrogenase [Mycobacterium avium subsp. hominissu